MLLYRWFFASFGMSKDISVQYMVYSIYKKKANFTFDTFWSVYYHTILI